MRETYDTTVGVAVHQRVRSVTTQPRHFNNVSIDKGHLARWHCTLSLINVTEDVRLLFAIPRVGTQCKDNKILIKTCSGSTFDIYCSVKSSFSSKNFRSQLEIVLRQTHLVNEFRKCESTYKHCEQTYPSIISTDVAPFPNGSPKTAGM